MNKNSITFIVHNQKSNGGPMMEGGTDLLPPPPPPTSQTTHSYATEAKGDSHFLVYFFQDELDYAYVIVTFPVITN